MRTVRRAKDALERMREASRLLSSKPTEFASAYDAGFDAGLNSPNTVNCNCRWFGSKESSAEWSRGNEAGMQAKGKR